jgi:hypothetical protein
MQFLALVILLSVPIAAVHVFVAGVSWMFGLEYSFKDAMIKTFPACWGIGVYGLAIWWATIVMGKH